MPLAATITAFYNFSANTKARASQVNANFDVFRGHIIPIDPNTVSSANNTYDLGSSEYRWRNGYINNLSSLTISASTIISNTLSTENIKLNDSASSYADIIIDSTSSSSVLFKINGTDKFLIHETNGITTTASKGFAAYSAEINFVTGTTGSYHITGSTCTITNIGRPIMVGICPFATASVGGFISVFNSIDTPAYRIDIVRDGVIIRSHRLLGASGDFGNISSFFSIDYPGNGTFNYSIYISQIVASTSITFTGVRTFALPL